ncbi:MAG: N-acetyltransferase family protein [Pseudomonadota bacterium]
MPLPDPAPNTSLPHASVFCREAQVADGEAISRIHREGLSGGHASFRDAPYPAETAWRADGRGIIIVAEAEAGVVGWASVTPTSDRCAYAGVGEVSLYVGSEAQGRGIGGVLLTELIERSETAGFWTLTAQIFPENGASLAVFARHGFAPLGTRRALGRMGYGSLAGHWRDVVGMERRSTVVGID